MPATKEQLHEAMKSVGITADNPQDFFINGFANTEHCPFDVPLSVIQSGSVDELNYLGKLLEMQRDEDKEKFAAAVTLGEYAGSMKDLINLAQNLDCYWIYPTVQSEKDYGYYLIDELDELELPEEAKKYFMYEEYGRDAVKNDRGIFTEQGYIYNNKNTFSEWYNGRESDIPKEYRIMSYPQPERADMDAAVTAQAATEPRPVIAIIPTSNDPTEKLKEITDRLEQGITDIFDSERYTDYLRVMSKFHNYSFNNTLLIAMQAPDATHVMGFQAWKDPAIGRNVKAGEKGIRIIAPSPYKPYPTWALSNNNAEIRRIKERITALTRRKEIGYVGWEFGGGKVEANAQDNRLQIFFDEKPTPEVREELKGNGFKWSPKAEAWQRQLNDNAIYAADRIKSIQPLTGERPTEIQKRARQQSATQEQTTEPQEAPTQDKTAEQEYIYMVHANPRSESMKDRYFLQAYVPQENGQAKIGDVLFVGTPDKCRELMQRLTAGELTQGEVKELFAQQQATEQAQTQEEAKTAPEAAEPDKDTFSIYQLKRGDETRDLRFEP